MIKKVNKKALSLIMAGITLITIPTFTSCVKKNEDGIYVFGTEINQFNKYKKTRIKNGKPVTVYPSQNISIAYDKNNFSPKEYIYDFFHNPFPYGVIYDLEEENLLLELTFLNVFFSDDRNKYDKFIENNYIVNLRDIENYIEGTELKEYYTLDEIHKLEPKILESLKLMIDYEQKQKVK